MKKAVIGLIILLVLVVSALWYIKNTVGDLRPMLLPPIKKKLAVTTQVKRGKPLDFDLVIKDGFEVGLFAENLGTVRDLDFSPGGTLIASVPSDGKIIMLPDRNADGIADEVDTIVSGLSRPHGIAFFNNNLYIAEETRVSRYLWTDQKLIGGVARLEKKLFDLPKGDRHFTRTIAFDKKGTMYVSIGSSCDVCFEKHSFLASVIVSDSEGIAPKLFAKGLRNSPFITIKPDTYELWGTEMGRDFLGDELPPDEINIIRGPSVDSASSPQAGPPKDYGWPECYGKNIHDDKFDTRTYKIRAGMTICEALGKTSSIYDISAHSAPLGLTFINSSQFPQDWQGDLLVAYHGSWNRSTPIGYKVVRMIVDGDRIIGEEDFLSGFLQSGSAIARPVDVEFDSVGNLYISDDKSGNIFIVSKK